MYQRVMVTNVEGVPDGEADLVIGGDSPVWLIAFTRYGRRWTRTVPAANVTVIVRKGYGVNEKVTIRTKRYPEYDDVNDGEADPMVTVEEFETGLWIHPGPRDFDTHADAAVGILTGKIGPVQRFHPYFPIQGARLLRTQALDIEWEAIAYADDNGDVVYATAVIEGFDADTAWTIHTRVAEHVRRLHGLGVPVTEGNEQ